MKKEMLHFKETEMVSETCDRSRLTFSAERSSIRSRQKRTCWRVRTPMRILRARSEIEKQPNANSRAILIEAFFGRAVYFAAIGQDLIVTRTWAKASTKSHLMRCCTVANKEDVK